MEYPKHCRQCGNNLKLEWSTMNQFDRVEYLWGTCPNRDKEFGFKTHDFLVLDAREGEPHSTPMYDQYTREKMFGHPNFGQQYMYGEPEKKRADPGIIQLPPPRPPLSHRILRKVFNAR